MTSKSDISPDIRRRHPHFPFIHPEEKAIRGEAIAQGAGIIRICDNGFSDRFAPQGLEFDLAGTSRLLLITPGPHDTRRQTLTYRTAQALNTIALTLATLPLSTARFRPIPSTFTPSRPSPSRPE